MKFTNALLSVMIAGVALSAAAKADSYYVVQDLKTKKCTVTTRRPEASVATMVGPNGVVYRTRTEAEGALRTVKVCHTD